MKQWGVGVQWANLVALTYTTYNQTESWDARKNLTCSEPGCANPEDRVWEPVATALWTDAGAGSGSEGSEGSRCTVVAEIAFDSELHSKYGAPLQAYIRYAIDGNASRISVDLLWFNKTATRLPESLMVDFRPSKDPSPSAPNTVLGWEYDILGEWVAPTEVASGGYEPVSTRDLVWGALCASRHCPRWRRQQGPTGPNGPRSHDHEP